MPPALVCFGTKTQASRLWSAVVCFGAKSKASRSWSSKVGFVLSHGLTLRSRGTHNGGAQLLAPSPPCRRCVPLTSNVGPHRKRSTLGTEHEGLYVTVTVASSRKASSAAASCKERIRSRGSEFISVSAGASGADERKRCSVRWRHRRRRRRVRRASGHNCTVSVVRVQSLGWQ